MLAVRVLLIDDEPTAIESVRLALNLGLPYYGLTAECKYATTDDDAKKCIASLDLDVAVIDMRFAVGVSGLDLLEQIKARDSHVQCVILTAYPDRDDSTKAYALDAFDYVTKESVSRAISYGDVVLHRVLNAYKLGISLRYLAKQVSRELFERVLTCKYQDLPD